MAQNATPPTAEEIKKAHETLFAAGLPQRYSVFGEEYVNNSLSKATPLTEPMQKLVTEACWGSIWTRPGLEKKTRSLLVIAMMCALNHPTELKIHVRGAVRNGCTEQEIGETILQASMYCGMPAGLEGFKVAQEVLSQMKEAGEGPKPS